MSSNYTKYEYLLAKERHLIAITITFNFIINKLIMQSCNMIMVCNMNYTTKAWELIWLERIQFWCKIVCKFVFSKLYLHRHLHSVGFKFKFCYNEKIKINFLTFSICAICISFASLHWSGFWSLWWSKIPNHNLYLFYTTIGEALIT